MRAQVPRSPTAEADRAAPSLRRREQREAAASKVDDELSSTCSRVSFPNLDLLLRLRPEVRL